MVLDAYDAFVVLIFVERGPPTPPIARRGAIFRAMDTQTPPIATWTTYADIEHGVPREARIGSFRPHIGHRTWPVQSPNADIPLSNTGQCLEGSANRVDQRANTLDARAARYNEDG